MNSCSAPAPYGFTPSCGLTSVFASNVPPNSLSSLPKSELILGCGVTNDDRTLRNSQAQSQTHSELHPPAQLRSEHLPRYFEQFLGKVAGVALTVVLLAHVLYACTTELVSLYRIK